MDDPRLTPARLEVAAKYLEGKVQAARFVEGESCEVIWNSLAVRFPKQKMARKPLWKP